MKRTKQLSIWIIAFWMAIAAGTAMAQGVNMNRYITLTVKSGQDIKLRFQAAAANTPVRVVSGSKSTDVTVGSSWNQTQTFKSDGTTMTVYGDIIGFGCMENGSWLTALDFAHNIQLEGLYCHKNQLTALNVSRCTQLKTLYCYKNQLTSLDVNGCTQLKTLHCYENQLTALNVSGCTQLKTLYCNKN
ncbi:leucine-rich repeat domain-containing protein [Tannerella forsythia]|uniref:Leucine-rich repeat domain-containing protein n=1 Tax=Tannerella forsythia TaxID=28112 RepID=A0A3P1YEZ8_TANFO|nr:leucine-rich repeat domain-containing protein [Tannerella forsythia]RRD69579.1 leucine-rich repeat domain-containing protein [Tannerella forsythia]